MTLQEKLYDKMYKELTKYKQNLLSKTPDEILKGAEEYYIKLDIVLSLEYMQDLPEEQAKALLDIENPLQEVYLNWLNQSSEYMYEVRMNILETAEKNLRGE